jgi:hypothetical protein
MATAREVIQQIAEACDRGGLGFPHFDLFLPIDARLSAYRADANWALVIETLVFNDGPSEHDCIVTMAFCYGEELPQQPGAYRPHLCVTGDGPSGPLFDHNDVAGHLISPAATDMAIRGKVVPVTTDPAKYAAAGIELAKPPRAQGHELLRLIAPAHRRLFFLTEAEIAARIGSNMPLLLRLDEWRHPDREKGEDPENSDLFKMIAEAIAANDPDIYQPKESPNTHWRNWPTAGIM